MPDRPLTRREIRERERARQEAQQRMLAPQRSGSGGARGTSTAVLSRPEPAPEPPPARRSATVPAEETGQHGRRSARSSEARDAAGSPQATGTPLAPTSAAMGWAPYPPSSVADSPAVAHTPYATGDDAGPPPPLPAPIPAVRTAPDGGYRSFSSDADFPAAPAFAPAPGYPEPDSGATTALPAVSAAQPQTRVVERVQTSDGAPIRRNVFPAAAQAFTRGRASVASPARAAGASWDVRPEAGAAAALEPRSAEPAFDEAPFGHHVEDLAFDDSEGVFGEPVASKAPRRRGRRLRVFIGLALALALFVGAALLGVQALKPILGIDKVTDFPGPGTGSVVVTVQPGSGPAAVAGSLEKEGVVADSATFLKAFAAAGGSLHPGDYTFKKGMSSAAAAQILTASSNDKVIYFALSAGMRVGESLDAIAKGGSIDRKDLDALNAKPADFGLPAKAKNLEGYLAPGEYKFPIGTSPKEILTKLVTTTLDTLKADGVTDPNKQYDVLTVASIVQAEGGQADYGNVAGAIFNRLKPNPETNGYIQSDATVTYGLGKKSYHLTDQEKTDKGNPYNTYANPGLPAGPIGSPGAKAVNAAANPTANSYLYWVTVNLDTGETKFSSTYAQHQVYAQQYEQWCKANAGKCQ